MVKTKLMPSQQRAFDYIKDKKRFGLFKPYGSGKTLVVLQYIAHHKLRKILIVAPKVPIMKGGTWETQIREHTNIPLEYFTFINYESLHKLPDWDYDFAVFDESLWIKNPRAKRTKLSRRIAKRIKRACIMTGFPIAERIQDIHQQIFLLDSEILGTYWQFLNRYFYKLVFKWTLKKNALGKILEVIKPLCYYEETNLQKEFNLVAPNISDVPIPLLKQQTAIMKNAMRDFVIEKGDYCFTTTNVLALMTKFRQICSGFLIGADGKPAVTIPTLKDEQLLYMLEAIQDKKVIIWCEFRYEIEKIYNALSKKYSCIHTLDKESTDEKISRFKKDSNTRILITTPARLGAGENLYMVSYIIRYSPPYSLHLKENSDARTYRKGSEMHDHITYSNFFTVGTIEEQILKALKKKRDVITVAKRYMEEIMKDGCLHA